MRDINAVYNEWLKLATLPEIRKELEEMTPDMRESAFFKDLSFGTGGLRGVMSAGTNRMNYYTVAKATRGLAAYINGELSHCKKVAIGYDSRNNSEEFARTAARILASLGITVYIYRELLPTPMLSYAVRVLGCSMGIMITASHNPAEYNGYKVYREDGCQITEEVAEKISENIEKTPTFTNTEYAEFDTLLNLGAISYIGDDVYESFISEVLSQSVIATPTDADKSIKVVYSPLNGTGRKPVLRTLAEAGFTNVKVVSEQEMPDGNFTTCPYPNPEIPEAMRLGLEYAKDCEAELLLATDPDCDRVGVGVRLPDGAYTLLTGNEVGLLLLDFICKLRTKNGTMPKEPVIVKTIVTTDLAEKIAASYGVQVANVLTGFKYIGEYIGNLEAAACEENYIFGFEESCGYLSSGYVRDKDGVCAALLVCEVAAYYRRHGKSLYEALLDIYKTYGFCQNTLKSYSFDGPQGFSDMQRIMQSLRGGVDSFAGIKVRECLDYSFGIDGLPKSDVLKFLMDGDCSVVVRPSGTEPKLKLYVSVNAENPECASDKTNAIIGAIESFIK